MKGTIKFFNEGKGFGFIAGDGGNEYFVHLTDLEGVEARDLQEGTAVEFEVVQGDKGPKAAHVKLDQGGAEEPAEEAPAEEEKAEEEAPAEEELDKAA
jgi:CspA family cold shock protein